jgi:hypothetical protein
VLIGRLATRELLMKAFMMLVVVCIMGMHGQRPRGERIHLPFTVLKDCITVSKVIGLREDH